MRVRRNIFNPFYSYCTVLYKSFMYIIIILSFLDIYFFTSHIVLLFFLFFSHFFTLYSRQFIYFILYFRISGSGTGDQGPSSFTGNHGKSFSYGKSLNGIETATARKLLNRLKSFTNISLNGAITNSSNNGFNKYGNDNDDDSENGENDELFHEFESDGILNGEERMVEKDVFGYISRISGMVLTDSDLTVLADCTDFNPIGERIKVDVVLECLNNYPVNNDIKKKKRDRNNNYDDNDNDENEKMKNGYYDDDNNYIAPNNPENSLNIEVLSEPALFALKHISHQIWRTADTLKRYKKKHICVSW